MFEEDKTHIEREKFLKHEITPSIVWTFPWPEGTKPIIDCCKSMLKLGYQKLRKKYIKGSSVDKQTSTTKKSQKNKHEWTRNIRHRETSTSFVA